MDDLRPRMEDASLNVGGLSSNLMWHTWEDKGRIIELLLIFACRRVWTYSAPTLDPIEINHVRRALHLSRRKTIEFIGRASHYFRIDGDHIYLIEENSPIQIGALQREAISRDVRLRVLERDGERCHYCGSIVGPFHLDHVHPVILGGASTPDNLVVACRPCNMSKGPLTIEEWLIG